MIEIDVNGITMEIPSSAADTNWAAKQVNFEQALVQYVDQTASAVGNVAELTWVAITPQNSWENDGTVDLCYGRQPNGIVFVRGIVSGGSAATVCGTLPEGNWPLDSIRVVQPCAVTDDATMVVVGTDGTITINASFTGGEVGDGVVINLFYSVSAGP